MPSKRTNRIILNAVTRAVEGMAEDRLPCGECHLQQGETCDICGAKEPRVVDHRNNPLSEVLREAIARVK